MYRVLRGCLLLVSVVGVCVNCTAFKQSTFKFAPPIGLIYYETAVTSTAIHTPGTFLAESSSKIKSEVRVKETSKGFEFIKLIQSAEQYTFGRPEVNVFMNALEGREIKYLVDREGSVYDIEGVEAIIEEAEESSLADSSADLHGMVQVIKLDFMSRWQDRVESTLAIRGGRWAVEKDLNMMAGGASRYFVAYRVKGSTDCGGVKKCVLIDYSYHNNKSEIEGYKIKSLSASDVGGVQDSSSFNIEDVFVSGSGSRVVDPETSLIYKDYHEFVIDVEATIEGNQSKKLKTITRFDYNIDSVKNVN